MQLIQKITTAASKLLPKDFKHTSKVITDAVKTGWQTGKTQAAIDNKGLATDMYMRTKAMTREIGKLKFTKEDIPAVSAVIGNLLPIPIPGLTIWSYFAGIGIKKVIDLAQKLQ